MSESSIIEDLERYRRNNVELALALNEMKTELNMMQMQLLEQKRELQTVYDENATLKQTIAQKDSQMNTWRAVIVDLVTTNTKKYTEMMQKVGLVPAANETVNRTTKTETKTSITVEPSGSSISHPTHKSGDSHSTGRTNVQRRPRSNEDDSPDRLSDLTEETSQISNQSSQFDDTKSSTSSPEMCVNHVTSRRRTTSVPLITPNPPLREIQERMVGNGESKGKKSSRKVKKMDKIIDENTPTNGINATGGRSQRRAAPKNLSEPKLSTKLRRN